MHHMCYVFVFIDGDLMCLFEGSEVDCFEYINDRPEENKEITALLPTKENQFAILREL